MPPSLPSIRQFLLIRQLSLGTGKGLRFSDAKVLPLPWVPVYPVLLLCPLLGENTLGAVITSFVSTSPSLSKTLNVLTLTLSHPPACQRKPRVKTPPWDPCPSKTPLCLSNPRPSPFCSVSKCSPCLSLTFLPAPPTPTPRTSVTCPSHLPELLI